jgi:hypothetical protein
MRPSAPPALLLGVDVDHQGGGGGQRQGRAEAHQDAADQHDGEAHEQTRNQDDHRAGQHPQRAQAQDPRAPHAIRQAAAQGDQGRHRHHGDVQDPLVLRQRRAQARLHGGQRHLRGA